MLKLVRHRRAGWLGGLLQAATLSLDLGAVRASSAEGGLGASRFSVLGTCWREPAAASTAANLLQHSFASSAGSRSGTDFGAKPRRGPPRGSKHAQKPLDPAVEGFLAAKGVDTGKLVAALPQRASDLTLAQVEASWRVLEQFAVPDIPGLLAKAPYYLAADVEDNLRPKLEALGIRGKPLGTLLRTQPAFAYTPVGTLLPLLGRAQHYLGAAAAAGLLPDSSLASHLAGQPGLWSAVVCCDAKKVDGSFEALQSGLGLSEADFGAVVAGFPPAIAYSESDIRAKCHALAEVLGGRQRAAELVRMQPELLFCSAVLLRANTACLQQQLGWTAAEVASWARQYPKTFGRDLQAPARQFMMQRCQEVLALPPSAMLRQHASSLHCSPEAALPRLAFVAHRGLQLSIKTCRFLKDTGYEWTRRLRGWGIPEAEWAEFEAGYWRSPEGAALKERIAAAAAEKRAGTSARLKAAHAARRAAQRRALQ